MTDPPYSRTSRAPAAAIDEELAEAVERTKQTLRSRGWTDDRTVMALLAAPTPTLDPVVVVTKPVRKRWFGKKPGVYQKSQRPVSLDDPTIRPCSTGLAPSRGPTVATRGSLDGTGHESRRRECAA